MNKDEPGSQTVRLPTAHAFDLRVRIDSEQTVLIRHVGKEMGPALIFGHQGLDMRIRQPRVGSKR